VKEESDIVTKTALKINNAYIFTSVGDIVLPVVWRFVTVNVALYEISLAELKQTNR